MHKRLIILIFLLFPVNIYSQNVDIELLRMINSPEVLPSDNFWRFVSNSEIYVGLGIPAGIGTTWIFMAVTMP